MHKNECSIVGPVVVYNIEGNLADFAEMAAL